MGLTPLYLTNGTYSFIFDKWDLLSSFYGNYGTYFALYTGLMGPTSFICDLWDLLSSLDGTYVT